MTKEGAIAGPRVLEHIVDTVLYFEGDTHSSFRLVRAIKNRFGAANELGVFAMTERGLKGVANPSALFLSQHAEPVAGQLRSWRRSKARGRCWSRSRRWSIRCRAECARRLAVGLDPQRLALLLAVLHRHGGVETGGSTSSSTRSAACASTSRRPISRSFWPSIHRSRTAVCQPNLLYLVKLDSPVKFDRCSAARSGCARRRSWASERAMIPAANRPKHAIDGMDVITVARIGEALQQLRA